MKVNITLFAQIAKYLEKSIFNDLVKKHESDHACKSFNSWTHISDLFKDYYFALMHYLGQHLNIKRTKLRIKAPVHLLDSSTISLCLSLFDWAHFRSKKGYIIGLY